MALVELFGDQPWPAEGRTLGEVIERLLVGRPELWAFMLHWAMDSPLPKGKPPTTFFLPPFQIGARVRLPDRDPRYRRAVAACLPLLDEWDDGSLVAKARPGGPLQPPVDIPPPRAGYTLTIRSLLRSVIVDPTTRLLDQEMRYYDVRFFLAERAAPKQQKTVRARPNAIKNTATQNAKARRRSCNHIAELMRASPNKPTHTQPELRQDCIGQYGVKWRGFDEAWKDALELVPAAKKAWTRGGRRY